MAANKNSNWLIDDVAGFLASNPTREQLLAYRPSPDVQKRFHELLAKSKIEQLGADEEWELNQFEHLEMLMQSVKARLRKARPVRSS